MKHAFAQAPAVPSSELKQQYDAAVPGKRLNTSRPISMCCSGFCQSGRPQTGDLERPRNPSCARTACSLINPDLPRVRLEIGRALYYRLGSYEVARTYLDTAAENRRHCPRTYAARHRNILRKSSPRRKPSSTGAAKSSSAGATSPTPISAPRASRRAAVSDSRQPQPARAWGTADWGVVSSAVVRHRYDFGNQDKGALENPVHRFMPTASSRYRLRTSSLPRP